MANGTAAEQSLPIGVVVRKAPGVTRWAAWSWRATGVLPGAGPADWRVLRQEGDVTEYHAATSTLELWPSDTEAYLSALSEREPSVFIVLREDADSDPPLKVLLVTVSPFEAQDYADSGEDLVEKVPMTDGLIAWIRDFVAEHHREEAFIKRKRDKKRIDMVEDGRGDARINQLTDVYRAPRSKPKERLQ